MKYLLKLLDRLPFLHDWEHLETFIVEGREMDRQRCSQPGCGKTRITRNL
jgi:hypothetical protein